MSDLIYYCTKENNNCPKQNECMRYIDSEMHECKATLYKNACTDANQRILFIKKANIDKSDNKENVNNDAKEGVLTEQ